MNICLWFVSTLKGLLDAKNINKMCSHTESQSTAAACTEGEGKAMHNDEDNSTTARLNMEETLHLITCLCQSVHCVFKKNFM